MLKNFRLKRANRPKTSQYLKMTLAPNDKGHVNQVANHSGGFSMLGDKTNFLPAQLLYTTCLSVRLVESNI